METSVTTRGKYMSRYDISQVGTGGARPGLTNAYDIAAREVLRAIPGSAYTMDSVSSRYNSARLAGIHMPNARNPAMQYSTPLNIKNTGNTSYKPQTIRNIVDLYKQKEGQYNPLFQQQQEDKENPDRFLRAA